MSPITSGAFVILAFISSTQMSAARVDAAKQSCVDPVAGVWQATWHSRQNGDWHRFTLRIDRKSPRTTQLWGFIDVDVWSGDEHQTSPPACGFGVVDKSVRMTGKGKAEDTAFHFDGSNVVITAERCGSGGYSPDVFNGRIVGETLVVETHDTGGRAVERLTFKRLRCRIPPEP